MTFPTVRLAFSREGMSKWRKRRVRYQGANGLISWEIHGITLPREEIDVSLVETAKSSEKVVHNRDM